MLNEAHTENQQLWSLLVEVETPLKACVKCINFPEQWPAALNNIEENFQWNCSQHCHSHNSLKLILLVARRGLWGNSAYSFLLVVSSPYPGQTKSLVAATRRPPKVQAHTTSFFDWRNCVFPNFHDDAEKMAKTRRKTQSRQRRGGACVDAVASAFFGLLSFHDLDHSSLPHVSRETFDVQIMSHRRKISVGDKVLSLSTEILHFASRISLLTLGIHFLPSSRQPSR